MSQTKVLKDKSLLNENNYHFIEKINIKDFKITQKISKCNYGYIALCKKNKTNQIYALKILKKSKLLDNKCVERQYNEYKNLSLIYHPFIIELKGINHTDPYNLYYLYELVPGGALNNYLKVFKVFPLNYARFYSASLITILDYIHKKNIIHRDINLDSIYLNYNGYIKLLEFTFSKYLKNNDLTYSLCGQPEYYAPEMINKSGYNISVDFWQLGIVLYEMLVGYTPFTDTDPVNICNKINKGKIHFPKKFDKNAKLIIKQFLNIDINKRLGCTKRGIYEIIEHPFFQGFDWEKLLHRKIEAPIMPKYKVEDFHNYRFLGENSNEDNEALPKDKDPFYNWV